MSNNIQIEQSYKKFLKNAVDHDDSSTVEIKYFYCVQPGVAIGSSASWGGTDVCPTSLSCLFCPNLGTTSRDRIGNTTSVYNIEIQGGILESHGKTSTTLGSTKIRLVLVWNKQCNNIAGSIDPSNIFYTNSGTIYNNVDAPQQSSSFGAIAILSDISFCLNKKALCRTYPGPSYPFILFSGTVESFKIQLDFSKNPIIVNFNGNNGDITDVVDNNFFLYANRKTNGFDFGTKLIYSCRVKFLNLTLDDDK